MPRFVRSELGVELKDTILNGSSIVRVSVCGCCQGFLNSGSLEGVSLEVCVVRQTLAVWDAVCIDWYFQAANQSSSFWVPLLF